MTEVEKLDLLRRLRIVGKGRDKTERTVTLPVALFDELMRAAFTEMVPDSWYLNRYPDVAGAVKKGLFKTGSEHFVSAGLYEGRIPYGIEIDEAEYLKTHRDVARAIETGAFTSASDHFYKSGFNEGRAFKLISASSKSDTPAS